MTSPNEIANHDERISALEAIISASIDGAGNVVAPVVGPPNTHEHDEVAAVATTDATVTTLQTIAIPTTTTVLLEARVAARRTGGAGGAAEDGAGYVIVATIKNVAGAATLIGAVAAVATMEDQAGWDATIDVNAGNARIRVTGAATNNINWECSTRILSVS